MIIKLQTACGCIGYREVDERVGNLYELIVPIAVPVNYIKEPIDPMDIWATYKTRKFTYMGMKFDELHHKQMPIFEERT